MPSSSDRGVVGLSGGAEASGAGFLPALGPRRATIGTLEFVGLTDSIRVGVTALACKKAYPVVVDDVFEVCGDVVSVSAGQRGMQILLSPADYLRAVGDVVGGAISYATLGARRRRAPGASCLASTSGSFADQCAAVVRRRPSRNEDVSATPSLQPICTASAAAMSMASCAGAYRCWSANRHARL